MTQVMNLLVLSPDMQERVLVGAVGLSERGVRPRSRQVNWAEQSNSR